MRYVQRPTTTTEKKVRFFFVVFLKISRTMRQQMLNALRNRKQANNNRKRSFFAIFFFLTFTPPTPCLRKMYLRMLFIYHLRRYYLRHYCVCVWVFFLLQIPLSSNSYRMVFALGNVPLFWQQKKIFQKLELAFCGLTNIPQTHLLAPIHTSAILLFFFLLF